MHLPVVVEVARRRSFAGAGAALTLSPSAVSHAVRLVETQLGTPLFNRTTRSVSLTEAGRNFLARVLPALAEIQEVTDATRALKGCVSGVLRINAPHAALPLVMSPLLVAAAEKYPDLIIEVTSDDALIDVVEGGYDAGIRLGNMVADDMVAVRLTPPFKAVMVASPKYLRTFRAPKNIADLQRHNCIGYRLISAGGTYAWDLVDKGQEVRVTVKGSARVTDPLFAMELALANLGIAYLFEPLARKHIAAGRLALVLPDTAISEPGLFLYYSRRASEATKLRAFIDLAKGILKANAR